MLRVHPLLTNGSVSCLSSLNVSIIIRSESSVPLLVFPDHARCSEEIRKWLQMRVGFSQIIECNATSASILDHLHVEFRLEFLKVLLLRHANMRD